MCFTAVSGQAIYFLKCQRNATQKFKKFSPRVVRGTVCLTLVFFLPPVKYPYPRRKGAKYVSAFQLSYQNKSCSECQQDVRKIERQAERQTDRQTDRRTDRQTDFSAQLSKQKLFRMSTGCQKVSQTDRKIYSDRETE